MSGSTRKDVLVALALVVSLALLAWTAVISPLQNWKAAKIEARDQLIAEIEKLHLSVANLHFEKSQFESTEEIGLLWKAEQTGTATAMIQAEISRMAREQGLGLRSISPVLQREINHANVVGIRIETEAALDQLSDFLRDVEYSTPALLVERATIRRLVKSENKFEQPLVFAQIDFSAPVLIGDGARQ